MKQLIKTVLTVILTMLFVVFFPVLFMGALFVALLAGSWLALATIYQAIGEGIWGNSTLPGSSPGAS